MFSPRNFGTFEISICFQLLLQFFVTPLVPKNEMGNFEFLFLLGQMPALSHLYEFLTTQPVCIIGAAQTCHTVWEL